LTEEALAIVRESCTLKICEVVAVDFELTAPAPRVRPSVLAIPFFVRPVFGGVFGTMVCPATECTGINVVVLKAFIVRASECAWPSHTFILCRFVIIFYLLTGGVMHTTCTIPVAPMLEVTLCALLVVGEAVMVSLFAACDPISAIVCLTF